MNQASFRALVSMLHGNQKVRAIIEIERRLQVAERFERERESLTAEIARLSGLVERAKPLIEDGKRIAQEALQAHADLTQIRSRLVRTEQERDKARVRADQLEERVRAAYYEQLEEAPYDCCHDHARSVLAHVLELPAEPPCEPEPAAPIDIAEERRRRRRGH